MLYYWFSKGRSESEWFKFKSRLEIPPVGYTGSLAGTGWDPDEVIKGYEQGGPDPSRR